MGWVTSSKKDLNEMTKLWIDFIFSILDKNKLYFTYSEESLKLKESLQNAWIADNKIFPISDNSSDISVKWQYDRPGPS